MPAVSSVLGLLAAKFSTNPVSFIVKAARAFYSTSATVVGVAWYLSWRNQRVSTGDKSVPIPGVSKLPKINRADRPDPAIPSTADISRNPVPGGTGIPTTPFDSSTIVTAPGGQTASDGGQLLQLDGKLVAAWIVPILKYGRAHGWRGSVFSGFRTFADQTRIYNSGVRPAAVPGTSNHEKAKFPGGAVDVTMAPQLSAILLRSAYKDALVYAGAKDPVHFSHPHNGGY